MNIALTNIINALQNTLKVAIQKRVMIDISVLTFVWTIKWLYFIDELILIDLRPTVENLRNSFEITKAQVKRTGSRQNEWGTKESKRQEIFICRE